MCWSHELVKGIRGAFEAQVLGSGKEERSDSGQSRLCGLFGHRGQEGFQLRAEPAVTHLYRVWVGDWGFIMHRVKLLYFS